MNDKLDYWAEPSGMGKRTYQMGPQSHRIYLLNLLKEKGVGSILDVGCGTAPLYDMIFDKMFWGNVLRIDYDFTYKGVDPSEWMIKSCNLYFPEGKFEIQNAVELKEADKSFDAVVFMHSLDYVYDYMKALYDAKRIARKYILIVLWMQMSYSPDGQHELRGPDSMDPDKRWDFSLARGMNFNLERLKEDFNKLDLKLILYKNDEEINKEGHHNTLFLLEV